MTTLRELSTAAGDLDGLHINEDGSVVAIAGDNAVAVPLTAAEMRAFASMLQRAASFIERGIKMPPKVEVEASPRYG